MVAPQRVFQHLAGCHVEVVGGLVEHQEVRGAQQQLGEREPRLLAAGEHLHLLLDIVAREEEGSEVAAQARHVVGARRALELLEHRAAGIEHLELVLRVEGDLHLVARLPLAGVGSQRSGRDAQQRGLAGAVGAGERNAVAAPHQEVHALVDARLAVALVNPLEAQDRVAGPRRRRDAQAGTRRRLRRELHELEPLQQLDTALHLARLRGLVAEALDEAPGLGDAALLVALRRHELLAALLLLLEEAVVVALVEAKAPRLELRHAPHVAPQEAAVVGDHHHRPAELGERLLEPLDGREVQVVGGLVEQQHVGRREQQLRQLHAHQPAAAEGGERPPGSLTREA